jgi:hypothetical protein
VQHAASFLPGGGCVLSKTQNLRKTCARVSDDASPLSLGLIRGLRPQSTQENVSPAKTATTTISHSTRKVAPTSPSSAISWRKIWDTERMCFESVCLIEEHFSGRREVPPSGTAADFGSGCGRGLSRQRRRTIPAPCPCSKASLSIFCDTRPAHLWLEPGWMPPSRLSGWSTRTAGRCSCGRTGICTRKKSARRLAGSNQRFAVSGSSPNRSLFGRPSPCRLSPLFAAAAFRRPNQLLSR